MEGKGKAFDAREEKAMNERVKELADCAFDDLENDPVIIFKPEDLKEFAELIIQECVNTVLKEAGWYWNKQEFESSSAIHNAARRVQEHFGMKGVNNEPKV